MIQYIIGLGLINNSILVAGMLVQYGACVTVCAEIPLGSLVSSYLAKACG